MPTPNKDNEYCHILGMLVSSGLYTIDSNININSYKEKIFDYNTSPQANKFILGGENYAYFRIYICIIDLPYLLFGRTATPVY